MRGLKTCSFLLLIGLLLGCGRVRDARDAKARQPEGRRASYESVPGFEGEMYVLEAGRRNAPALVLVHGLGTEGARDFEPILPALSRRYHVLAFDLPGLARSRAVRGDYTPEAYARAIRALMERHLGKPACVLGHSMGGALAIQLAADAPELVRCLALLDVAGVLHYREYLREVVARSQDEAGVWTRARRGMRSLLLEIGLASAPRVHLEDAALDSSPLFRKFFTSSRVAALRFLQHDFGPALRAVRAPTFLGWGRDDTIASPRAADLLRAQLRPLVDERFDRSGHVPMRSEPKRLTASLLAFFERAAEPPNTGGLELELERDGRCVRERDKVFEGAYDSLTLYGCKGAVLRDVRARSLKMERSSAELVNVTLTTPGVAASLKRSRIKWTGGRIEAGVCIDADQTTLDLAGVTCHYERESIRVRGPYPLTASVSALVRDGRETRLHGEYQMFRTAQGGLASLRRAERPRPGQRVRASAADDALHPAKSAPDLAFADADDPNPGSGRGQILAGWISAGLALASGVQIPLCALEDIAGKIGEQRCRRAAIGVGTVALTLGVPWLVFGYKKRAAQREWRARHGFAGLPLRLRVDLSAEGARLVYGGAL